MAQLAKIDTSQFESDVLGSSEPVLVDFYADWCPPCRVVTPVLEELAGDVDGRAKIVKVNVDENPDLAERYNVRGIPTLILFKGGQIVSTKIGAQPKPVLRALLESAAAAPVAVAV